MAEYDVVIYGDTAAGVASAIQAARMGKTALLVSPLGHLGGMTSSGLGWTDIGNSEILGGISREFYHRVYQHYQDPRAWTQQDRSSFPIVGQDVHTFDPVTQLASVFEPKVAESIFDQMAREAGVRVIKGRVDRKVGVTMNGRRITALHLEGGTKVVGSQFIDASYEGDLMHATGVSYTVGREANSTFDEVSNAITEPVHGNNLPDGIDPFIQPGAPDSGLLPGVRSFEPADIGKADHRLQAFCYRMCLTDAPQNRCVIAKPAAYDETEYEILFRTIAVLPEPESWQFYKMDTMPNRKTDSNNTGGISTDFIGKNYSPLPPEDPAYWDWTTLSHEQRDALAAKHRDWQLGLIWTLQNHPRVPESIRDQHADWGLPKDEFPDNGHWPYAIYVREGRRMQSDFIMTEHQCRQNPAHPSVEDSIGRGAYTMDSHHTQRVIYQGQLKNEGDIQRSLGGKPYPISYRSIVPTKDECENLLVPWCLSASHIAFGSIRMEPVGMVLGQSAATAAALAIDARIPLQDLDYSILKTRLLNDGQVL